MDMAPEEEKKASVPMTNEQLIAMIKEKMEEKNEVIKEQQHQIQTLEEKILGLEEKLESLNKASQEREDLVKQLSQILE